MKFPSICLSLLYASSSYTYYLCSIALEGTVKDPYILTVLLESILYSIHALASYYSVFFLKACNELKV